MPESVNVPPPIFVRLPGPVMLPVKVVSGLLLPTLSATGLWAVFSRSNRLSKLLLGSLLGK